MITSIPQDNFLHCKKIMTEIHVCQSGSCRMRGSEAVLAEIEELVGSVDEHCRIRKSGCLGLCSQAPAAVVLKQDRRRMSRQGKAETYITRINTIEDSANVVMEATGRKPPTDNPEVQARLSVVRSIREREHAISKNLWNRALKATLDQIRQKQSNGANISDDLRITFQELVLKAAGYQEAVPPTDGCSFYFEKMPRKIFNYSQWSLEGVTQVSRHSVIFHFLSNDLKRGTPNPRGRGRPLPTPKTWHVTLLAEVGRNDEGPLPWVERDYTPISTAKEWEQGRCNILIKIYNDGVATSWLSRHFIRSMSKTLTSKASSGNKQPSQTLGHVWLSKPHRTLSVPALVTREDAVSAFNPASVLLLLAGTGVVAMPQILQHRDPQNKIGISTRKTNQLHVPIDLILSCRTDDVLLLPEIISLCREAQEDPQQGTNFTPLNHNKKGIRRCTILLTNNGAILPSVPNFDDQETTDNHVDQLRSLPNARVLHSRLTYELVSEAVSHMPKPCRIVVSGPSGFNAAARLMLLQANVNADAITILEA
jgi:hypothetical protein